MSNCGDGSLSHVHDDATGDILVIRRDDLPTETAETGAAYLRAQRIPGVLPSTISTARRNGHLKGTVLAGQTILYARSDLWRWVQSRIGNSEDYNAARRESLRGNQNARRSN